MNKLLKVELLTTIEALRDMERFAALAALTCHANTDKINNKGYKPSDTLKKIIKFGHESILEHISLTYSIKNLTRACLQELARHRHISLSVESTRHTLHKKLENEDLVVNYIDALDDENECKILQVFLGCAWSNPQMPNDQLKYYIPEFWPTDIIMTSNVRELRHIVKLRSAPGVLGEFVKLAHMFVYAVPEEFRYLFDGCIYSKKNKKC